MEKIEKREIKFEILRIISMVMIILTHYAGHGGLSNIEIMNTNKLIGIFLTLAGNLGVVLFVFISGYFLINSKFKIKKLLKLELQILFYSILFFIIYIICNRGLINNIDILKAAINSIFPVLRELYWFPTIYVGLYLLSPFINKLINNMERKNYKALLLILFLGISIIPTSMFSGRIVLFIYIYLIAAYVRKYDIELFKNRNYINILIALLTYLVVFVIKVICLYIGNETISQIISDYVTAHQSIFILLIAISIFMAFKNSNIKSQSKLLFTLGKTSFAVYLLHDNLYFREILWKKILHTNEFYYANTMLLILHIIASVILIYAVGTIIDLIREKCIEKPIFKIKKFDKLFEKVDQYMN